MKKFMISASALALSGSMAFAMDEDAMDEAMMMEAPAPSVTLGGSGELGFKHVDDGDDATEDIQLIREYKVSFSSSSTTDGGLVFGAGISIENTHDNDPDKSVKGSNVFIGAADGTWRLKFGGNDPGIEKAGGIGVADGDGFHYGGDDTTIGFEGSIGTTSYRITLADPRAKEGNGGDDPGGNTKADGDWSAGASTSLGDVSVGFGMDSEDGLAIGVGTTLQGIGVDLFWSKSEPSSASGHIVDPEVTLNTSTNANAGLTYTRSQENTGLGIKASVSAGEGATFSAAYSTRKDEYTARGIYDIDTTDDTDGVAASASRQDETKEIEIAFEYDLGGGATFKTSIVKEDKETTGSVTAPDNAFGTTDDDGDDPDVVSLNTSSDKTTLKALIAMSF